MKIIGTAAFCKINFGLEVLEKRSDGFHSLNTAFLPLPLADSLVFFRTNNSGITLDCSPSVETDDEKNLVVKAARLLQKKSHNSLGAHIILRKNIPTGAGLGGGSSDAAKTLTSLNKLWELHYSDETLHELAGELGSDVPFFLRHSAAIGTGRGEILRYFPFELPYFTLLLLPDIHVSTPWAYKQFSIPKPKQASDLQKILRDNIHKPDILRQCVVNDFEEVVFPHFPDIAALKNRLYALGAVFAQMSGSGAALYGFFETEDAVRAAQQSLDSVRNYVFSPISLQ